MVRALKVKPDSAVGEALLQRDTVLILQVLNDEWCLV
jgi:hypothetical protein